MRAGWLVVRAEARRSRWGLLGLALLVALVAGVVMAASAGARRTSGALDRFLADSATHDARMQAFVLGDREQARAIGDVVRDHEGVRLAAEGFLFSTDAGNELDFTMLVDPADQLYEEIDRPRVLEGRMPADDAPEEIVVNPTAAELLDLGAGDVLPARFFSPDDCAALAENEFLGFNSPEVRLEVVGVVRQVEDLQGSDVRSGAAAIGSPAFLPAYGEEACAVGYGMSMFVDEDVDLAALQADLLAAAPELDPLIATADETFAETTRSAIDVAVIALGVFAAVAAAAGLLVVGQATSRQVAAAGGSLAALQAVGLERRQRTAVLALPSVVAVVAGLALAAIGAVAASPLFPIGVARDAEPDLGVRVDALALAAVAVGVLALTTVVAAAVARRRAGGQAAVSVGASTVVGAALRAGAGPSTSIGLRLAYERTPDRTAVSSRTAIVGVLVGLAGVVGVAVMATSLAATRDEPERWGWSWDAKPDNGGDLSPADRRALADEPDVEAIAVLENGSVRFDDTVLQAHALTDRKGHTEVRVVDGRPPATPTEVGLGSAALDDLDVGLGDQVTVLDDEGGEEELTVVGETVAPMIDIASPGEGAILTAEALRRFSPEDGRQIVLTYRDGADADALEARLTERYGLDFSPGYARPQEPGRLANMADNRGLIVGLGAFFGLLALLGLGHAVVVSCRRQARSFAVLRSLGLRRAQVRRAVVVQAAAIVAAGAVIGVPVGVAVGRTAWLAAVGDLGMVDDPSTPAALIAAVTVAGLLAGATVAFAAGWLGARRRPAAVLRTE